MHPQSILFALVSSAVSLARALPATNPGAQNATTIFQIDSANLTLVTLASFFGVSESSVDSLLTFSYTKTGDSKRAPVVCISNIWYGSDEMSCFPGDDHRNVTLHMGKLTPDAKDPTKYSGANSTVVISEDDGKTVGTWKVDNYFDPKYFNCTMPPQIIPVVPLTCSSQPGIKGGALSSAPVPASSGGDQE